MEPIKVFLLNFASIITAGGVICGFALKVGKFILNNQLKPFEDKIEKMDKYRKEQHEETLLKINTLEIELHKNSLNTMKNTICNENIPLKERIEVGKEYIEHGGNGAVKIYFHGLEERYEKQLREEGKI